jgi:pimeloyl-ACP methyl ester carboxylesterase
MRMMSVPGLGQLMGLKTPDEATQRERMAGAVGRHAMDRVPQDLFELARSGQRIPGAGRSYRTLIRRILDRSGVRPGVTPAAGELARLSPPSLWVWGDADVFADAGFPGRLRAALPSQDLVVMPGAGHLPWLDDAAAVGRSVRTFLERLEGSARPPG